MGAFVVAVDVGTGSARAGIFDRQGATLGRASIPIAMNRTTALAAEHDSEDIWAAVCRSVISAREEAGIATDEVEAIGFDTIKREDSSMLEGHSTVVREGHAGSRDVTYRIVFHNGHLVTRKVIHQDVLDNPVDAIVKVGTRSPAPATNFASGSTVWDRIAQCESGGNWATNTGNGYYGGLQFSLSTWRGYGGTGLPSDASRETQIAIAIKVQAAQGWGAWPVCSREAGVY